MIWPFMCLKSECLTARCSHISLSWPQSRMAPVPSLCFKLDTHDHSWLHSAAILTRLKHIPKEHLIFILHLHACMNSIGPSQRQLFMALDFGCLWNSVKFWLPIKEMVACHYQFKLLVFHISILHISTALSWLCFPSFLFKKCVGACMCMGAHMPWCACRSQKAACGSQFSFFPVWVPVAEFSHRAWGPSHWSLRVSVFFFEKGAHCKADDDPKLLSSCPLKCWDYRHVLHPLPCFLLHWVFFPTTLKKYSLS